ncbi:MAG: hypothetical protein ABIQ16_20595 [Polyangiaceae bacterium]
MELKRPRTAASDRPACGNDLEVVLMDEDHLKGTVFNLVLMVWRRRTLAEPYRAGSELVRNFALKHPEGVGVLQVVETEASPPDAEARKAFADFLKLTSIQHFCVTHEGSGFKAASIRAITSGVHALARPTFAHAVHSTVAEAARWAVAQNKLIGRDDDWQVIERTLQKFRKMHLDQYPGPSK